MKWICTLLALATVGVFYATAVTQDKVGVGNNIPIPPQTGTIQPPSNIPAGPTAIGTLPDKPVSLDQRIPPAENNTPQWISPSLPAEEAPRNITGLIGSNADSVPKTSRLGVWKIDLMVSEGISNDGRTLILDNWLEEQSSDVQYSLQTNMPIQPRKYKLTKQRFSVDLVNGGNILMNSEGKTLSIEEARTIVRINNIVALVTSGEKPIASVLSTFKSNTLIVIYRGLSAN